MDATYRFRAAACLVVGVVLFGVAYGTGNAAWALLGLAIFTGGIPTEQDRLRTVISAELKAFAPLVAEQPLAPASSADAGAIATPYRSAPETDRRVTMERYMATAKRLAASRKANDIDGRIERVRLLSILSRPSR